jgi:hypothetical protein
MFTVYQFYILLKFFRGNGIAQVGQEKQQAPAGYTGTDE